MTKVNRKDAVLVTSPLESQALHRILTLLGEPINPSFPVYTGNHLIYYHKQDMRWTATDGICTWRSGYTKLAKWIAENVKVVVEDLLEAEKPKACTPRQQPKHAVRVVHVRHFKELYEYLTQTMQQIDVHTYDESLEQFKSLQAKYGHVCLALDGNKVAIVSDQHSDCSVYHIKRYHVISFKRLCKIVGMTYYPCLVRTQDGHDLYAGDKFYHFKNIAQKWMLNTSIAYDDNRHTLSADHLVVTQPGKDVAFKNKQLGIQWMHQQNSHFKQPTAVVFTGEYEADQIKSYIGYDQTKRTWEHMELSGRGIADHYAAYLDKVTWSFDAAEDCKKAGYTVIGFNEFAATVGIPQYRCTSEDGVRLYDRNRYFLAVYEGGLWHDKGQFQLVGNSVVNLKQSTHKAFASSVLLAAFVKNSNTTIVDLGGCFAEVTRDSVIIRSKDSKTSALQIGTDEWNKVNAAVHEHSVRW